MGASYSMKIACNTEYPENVTVAWHTFWISRYSKIMALKFTNFSRNNNATGLKKRGKGKEKEREEKRRRKRRKETQILEKY